MRFTSEKAGRLQLECELYRTGPDLFAHLSGGNAHIGAVALAFENGRTECIEAPSHREGALATKMARLLAMRFHCRAAVSCGIHYDAITRHEIEDIERLAGQICDMIIESHAFKKEMLKNDGHAKSSGI